MAAPASLKAIKPYLERATELQDKDPVVAYHCRLYALQEAMRLRANLPKEDMGFVMTLIFLSHIQRLDTSMPLLTKWSI